MVLTPPKLDPRLNDIWKGIIQDHFRAELALRIYADIGQQAKGINDAAFGKFFWAVEMMCQREFHIALGCLFEKEKKGYKIRSIPAILSYLNEHADIVTVHNLDVLRQYLVNQGRWTAENEPCGADTHIR